MSCRVHRNKNCHWIWWQRKYLKVRIFHLLEFYLQNLLGKYLSIRCKVARKAKTDQRWVLAFLCFGLDIRKEMGLSVFLDLYWKDQNIMVDESHNQHKLLDQNEVRGARDQPKSYFYTFEIHTVYPYHMWPTWWCGPYDMGQGSTEKFRKSGTSSDQNGSWVRIPE